MSTETEIKQPGDLARRATQEVKREEGGGDAVTLPTMVGFGETISFSGQVYVIQPLVVERKRRLDKLVEGLGEELYQSILIYDNPEGFLKMSRMGEQTRRAQMSERLSELKAKKKSEATDEDKRSIRILEDYLLTEISEEQVTQTDAQTALRTQMAALTTEQSTAMVKIAQLFLAKETDSGVVGLSLDEVRDFFPLNAFAPFLNRCLDVTQIHP